MDPREEEELGFRRRKAEIQGKEGLNPREKRSWDPVRRVPAPGCWDGSTEVHEGPGAAENAGRPRAGLRAHGTSLSQAALVPNRAGHRQLRDLPGLCLHHLQVRGSPGSHRPAGSAFLHSRTSPAERQEGG